jgi:hypothetical protein
MPNSNSNPWTLIELKSIHNFSFKNEQSIRGSKLCGCFYRKGIYPSTDILSADMIAEKDGKLTASCPICSIDAVLGDASVELTAEMLEAMRKLFFETF